MKTIVLITLAVFSLVSAESTLKHKLLEDAEPLLKTLEELPHFLEQVKEELPLGVVLGDTESKTFELLEKKIKQAIGKHIREYFEKFLKKIQDLGSHAGESFSKLEDTLKGEATAENAEKLINELLSLTDEQQMLEVVLEDLFSDSDRLKELTLYSRDSRGFGLGDILDRLTSWFMGLGSKISDSYDIFKNWAKDIFIKTMDTAKPITDQIKILAMDFIQSNWHTMSAKLVKQALSFFHPYAGILGGKIVEKLLEIAKDKGVAPWTDVTVSSVLLLK